MRLPGISTTNRKGLNTFKLQPEKNVNLERKMVKRNTRWTIESYRSLEVGTQTCEK